jgi:hypothetical protein
VFIRPSWVLRIEELALLAVGIAVYAHLHVSWWFFAALFLVPDIFMLGYLAGPVLGAAVYNLGHALFLPLALGAAGYASGSRWTMAVAAIWFCHIGWDRMLGYGLKYPTFFKDTHLQHIG